MNIYDILMIVTFAIGYFLITIEHITHINKTSIALLMAIICWCLQFANQVVDHEENLGYLSEHIANVSQVIFFLLGALTIVEIINAHRGFRIISDAIRIRSKQKLLWVIGILTFFLSAVLDNLTTTIIMVTLMSKLIKKSEERLLMGGAIVIAANAGGAWTPIGDVTTTMLWIGNELSTFAIMRDLFIPSIICFIFATFIIGLGLKGDFEGESPNGSAEEIEPMGKTVFWLGIGCLISVPVFKVLTGLPPFMGIIFGLGIMWLVTDIIHRRYDDRDHLRVPYVLTKIDNTGVLFFLGILLCIDALQTAGLLNQLANWMDHAIANTSIIAIVIGLASAVVDNVPLVAASMGMYELSRFPTDSNFWELIAYCAGTGGSILVIGSAAGVAFMGLEKVEFFWYFRRVGIPALIGYFAGVGAYFLIH